MRVLVHINAAEHYVKRCYRNAHPQSGMLHRPEWAEMLKKVEGQWLEVETEHLFSDQFNTVRIPGVSTNGMRLMIEDIAAVEGDVRQGVIKCNWCYGYDHDKDGQCDKCGKSEYLRPLNPIQPIVPNRTTKALGIDVAMEKE